MRIADSEYPAEFSRFALATDRALMDRLGLRDGAILAIELVIKKLSARTSSLRAWDMNNEFLGEIGLEDVEASLGSNEEPVRVRIPFHVRVTASGALEFSALEVSHNFNTVPIELKYRKLLVPQISVTVNGRQFYLNNTELERLVSDNIPEVLKLLRQHLDTFATKDLPQMLNEKAAASLQSGIEEIQHIEPPGKDPQDTRPDFLWGMRLRHLQLGSSLDIRMSAFVEDTWQKAPPPRLRDRSRGAPTLSMAPELYDIALSVDRGLINRILQLSFHRQNFSQVSAGDGTFMRLTQAPVVDFMPQPPGTSPWEAWMKIRIAPEIEPDSIAFKKKIVAEMDVHAVLRRSEQKKGFEIVLRKIDLDSVYIDPSYFSFIGGMFKGLVMDGVRRRIAKTNRSWSQVENVLPGVLDLPPALMGIKLDVIRVTMDPRGHLVMYT
ncbi:MAG: hypothetical protein N2578_09860, partial [Bdellovibrionaceae bacterium]|nr:hypothetical protein [Pseudobdellovibrionaceae bacterium]